MDDDGDDEEEDKDVDEVTAKNKDGRVYCTLSAVNFFFPLSQIQICICRPQSSSQFTSTG